MTVKVDVDAEALRDQVREKYRAVALDPQAEFHFHTGKLLAERLGYAKSVVEALPDQAVESFAGVANPFSLRDVLPGEKVLDAGSGSGFDCFVARQLVGESGHVVGIDMTDEMLAKSSSLAQDMDLDNVEFRKGLLEAMPVEDNWADVVISNGVINLCADKSSVMAEVIRVLRPGGYLQFADIANSKPVPASAMENIDLWTA